MTDWGALASGLSSQLGIALDPATASPVGGGSINEAWRIDGGGRRYFVKLNVAARADMFSAEADGLRELAAAGSLRVPAVLGTGTIAGKACLLLEWIDLSSPGSQADALLGRGLAALHSTVGRRFGWHRNNTIGSTPQRNDWRDDWAQFLRDCRLGPQFVLAADRGYGSRLSAHAERLLDNLEPLVGTADIEPSLLHGDLWSGNRGADERGEPVIFDPAVFYGDPEADIAMTELFGGFGPAFHDAYRELCPETVGAANRRALYRLYHLLNHLNLFGSGYLGQVEQTLVALLRAQR